MCGIVGTIGLADKEIIVAMNEAVKHRGPDDSGIYLDETRGVALGHRRLSIIDLSPAGHQPMSYMNNRYWTVYNGEIYNFMEIRMELEKKGYAFIPIPIQK
jgi:asparagine synthase (glutamine-hydrolysing)